MCRRRSRRPPPPRPLRSARHSLRGSLGVGRRCPQRRSPPRRRRPTLIRRPNIELMPRARFSLGVHSHHQGQAAMPYAARSKGECMAKAVNVALLVRLEAKAGKESDVENFLKGGLSVVQGEPATIAWFAIRLGPNTFGIFDVFPYDAGRRAHLTGRRAT